jgi:hypothetical protein
MPKRDETPPEVKDASVQDETLTDSADGSDNDVLFSDDVPRDDDASMIVYHQQVVDPATGQATVKTHGPMPVDEWAAYERDNGL